MEVYVQEPNHNLGPCRSDQDYIFVWIAIQQQELAITQILNPGDSQYDEDLVDDGPRAIDSLYSLLTCVIHFPHRFRWLPSPSYLSLVVDPNTWPQE